MLCVWIFIGTSLLYLEDPMLSNHLYEIKTSNENVIESNFPSRYSRLQKDLIMSSFQSDLPPPPYCYSPPLSDELPDKRDELQRANTSYNVSGYPAHELEDATDWTRARQAGNSINDRLRMNEASFDIGESQTHVPASQRIDIHDNTVHISTIQIYNAGNKLPVPTHTVAIKDRTCLFRTQKKYIQISPQYLVRDLLRDLIGQSRSKRVVLHRTDGLQRAVLHRHDSIDKVLYKVKYLEIVYAEQIVVIRRY